MNNTVYPPTSNFDVLSRFRKLLMIRRQIRAATDEELKKLYISDDRLSDDINQMVFAEWDKRDWLWKS